MEDKGVADGGGDEDEGGGGKEEWVSDWDSVQEANLSSVCKFGFCLRTKSRHVIPSAVTEGTFVVNIRPRKGINNGKQRIEVVYSTMQRCSLFHTLLPNDSSNLH